MTIKGPEEDNSFVFRQPDSEEKIYRARSGTRAYFAQLGMAIALLAAVGGLVALACYTYSKWGWAIFIVPK